MDLLRSMTENMQPAAYRPSESERAVLSVILQSDTPEMGYAQISSGEDMVSARDKLMRLGFISYDNGGVTLTPAGDELAQAQALHDNPVDVRDDESQPDAI